MTLNSTSAPSETPPEQIGPLAERAREAFVSEQLTPRFSAADLLDAVADQLEQARPELVGIAREETALGETRLEGELTRTVRQLSAFAELVRTGLELDAIIDTADPRATPPRPDQRRVAVPIGPVAVFAASNFPFAFSVAGGDTAAAWAAGCPVLLKAHPGHPTTSALTGAAVREAASRVGAPPAWFTMIYGATPQTGQSLVAADALEAVAFTGSYAGGTAIARAAAARERPIPAYCEMGSVNPVVVTPTAARDRGAEIAEGLAASITGSAGQLCTKPGLVLLVDDEAGRALAQALSERLHQASPAAMLYPDIRDRFATSLADAADDPRVHVQVAHSIGAGEEHMGAALLEVAADQLTSHDGLLEEIFGPASMIVWAPDADRLVAATDILPGSLTATVQAGAEDPVAPHLIGRLSLRAGRVIHNGYPTGVAVGHATVHGGPHPATSAPSHTSVGMTAVRRFLRPIGYQNLPDRLLPAALQDANPLQIPRRVNGVITTAAVTRG